MVHFQFLASAGFMLLVVGPALHSEEPLPRLYVLALGISKYPEPPKIHYAHSDSEAIAAAFKQHSKGLFSSIETRVLTNEKATRAAILDGMDWLRKSTTQKDFAVFYFAGHGVKDGNAVYLLPVDSDRKKLASSAIDAREFSKRLKDAKGQFIVMLDTDNSGRFETALSGEKNSPENGYASLCSAVDEEISDESHELRQGLFTAALLEGLSGKGNGKPGKDELKIRITDGAVYFKQLDGYVTDRVKQLSAGAQHPVTSVPRAFRDFPVSKP